MYAILIQVRERPEVMRPVMSDHRKRELLLQVTLLLGHLLVQC